MVKRIAIKIEGLWRNLVRFWNHIQGERSQRRRELQVRVKQLDDLEDRRTLDEEEAKGRKGCKEVFEEEIIR